MDEASSSRPVPPFLAKVRAARGAPSPIATSPTLINSPSAATAVTPGQSPLVPQPPPNALYLPPPAQPAVEEDLVPPENFAAVTQGVYRCGFPKKRNFKFLETLQLKTVLTLVLEDYPDANLEWCQAQDIQFMVGSGSVMTTKLTVAIWDSGE